MSAPAYLSERAFELGDLKQRQAVIVVDAPGGRVVFTREQVKALESDQAAGWLAALDWAESTSCHYCTSCPAVGTDSQGMPRCLDCTDAAREVFDPAVTS